MRQGFDDEFRQVLNDVLVLHKPDGRVFPDVKAHVSSKAILIIDVRLPIEAGDRLTRSLPNGLLDEFIVDDPGYQQGLEGIPSHFQVKVHRVAIPECKPKERMSEPSVQATTADFGANRSVTVVHQAGNPQETDSRPEDPAGNNPVPAGHPAHKVWEDATQEALEEVFRLNERMLGSQPLSPDGLPIWNIKLVVRKFQIWAKRNICVVRNDKDARAYEQWLDNYMQAWLDSSGGRFPDVMPQLKAQLLRACNHWKGNARAQVRAFGVRPGTVPHDASAAGSASANVVSDRPEELTGTSAGTPGEADNRQERDATSKRTDLVEDREPLAGAERAAHSLAPLAGVGKPDKGNLEILRGTDGQLKRAVNLDVAQRFGGVSRRAIEKAVKKGSLQAEGGRSNRRIVVQSLLKYFPPENNTN